MKNLTKFKITYIIGLLVLILSITVTFAAFIFHQTTTVISNFGEITILHKEYYDYSYNKASEDKKVAKLRKDTVAILDNITLSSNDTYDETEDEIYVDGKAYYTRSGSEGNYTYNLLEPYVDEDHQGDYEVGDEITGEVFELKKQYTGISTIGLCQYYNKNSSKFVDITANDNGLTASGLNISFTLNSVGITISCTVNQNEGKINTATITTNDQEKHYRVQLDIDGLGMLILDDDITNNSTNGYTVVDASKAIVCSASEDKFYTDEEEDEGELHPYLSQIGLHFEFKAEMAVYVRIHIRDAWEKIKKYTTSTRETYTIKDQISGKSPFAVNDSEWYYDEDNNIVYLKQMYVPEYDENNQLVSKAYTFNVNEAYFYQIAQTTAYTEYENVQVSFTIDIVQANRAQALWKIDPSTIGA